MGLWRKGWNRLRSCFCIATPTQRTRCCYRSDYAEHPDLFVSASHDVSPEIREYERGIDDIGERLCGLAQRYLDNLVAEAGNLGIKAPFFMMLSRWAHAYEEAKSRPVLLLNLVRRPVPVAPASRCGGEKNILAFDMGGTTAKLAMVEDGRPHVS